MRTKLTLSIFVYLLSSLCITISAKDLNPSYCNSIPVQPNGWNETEAKATLTEIPKDCQKIWCGFALDGTWSSWCEVPITFTPGDITVTTPRIIPSGTNWNPSVDAWPGGAASYKKPGFVAFCLRSPTNTDPKNPDCTAMIAPSNYDCHDSVCILKIACGNWALSDFRSNSTSLISKVIASSCSGGSDLNFYTQIGGEFEFTLDSPSGGAGYSWYWIKKYYKHVVDSVSFTYKTYTNRDGSGGKLNCKFKANTNGDDTLTFEYKRSLMSGDPINRVTVTILSGNISSINETNTEHSIINLFPNPATPSETITIKGEYASDAKVSIISAGGSIVGIVTPTIGADAMAVSLSELNLQSGIYFIRIESGEKVYSGKLCVK